MGNSSTKMSAKGKAAGSEISAKRKLATSGSWKKGQSGNPRGRMPDENTWAGALRWAGDLTGADAAQITPPEMAREFRKLGNRKLKEMVALRAMAALLFDVDARLFVAVMDRVDGKVAQALELSWKDEARKRGQDPDALINQFVAAMGAGSGGGGSVGDSEEP